MFNLYVRRATGPHLLRHLHRERTVISSTSLWISTCICIFRFTPQRQLPLRRLVWVFSTTPQPPLLPRLLTVSPPRLLKQSKVASLGNHLCLGSKCRKWQTSVSSQ
jgi:hypothetical protein